MPLIKENLYTGCDKHTEKTLISYPTHQEEKKHGKTSWVRIPPNYGAFAKLLSRRGAKCNYR